MAHRARRGQRHNAPPWAMLKEEDVWAVVLYQEIGGFRAGFLEDLTSTIFGQGSA